jgi:S1-C subfamily serine protease
VSLLSDLSRELAALAATGAAGVVGLEHRGGQGSGVVLSSDGYILTNAHVARAGGALRVRRPGGSAASARLVGADERTDLAVVRTSDAGPPPLQLADSRRVQVGQLVMAIGNPLGLDRSVSLGVVSALFRELPTRDGILEGLIQTDAAVNPGHSGGPLLDMEGRVVGINTAMLIPARGIGFAVPAQTASWVAAVLIQHGEVRRPYLGIRARSEELDPVLARDTGQARGVRVVGVEPGTPAAAGGLSGGDLLLAANDAPVATLDDLARVLVLARPVSVDVEVLRAGARRRLVVRPQPRAA